MPNRNREKSGSAIAGAGATTAGVGLIAGGVPGAKVDANSVFRMKHGEGRGARRVTSELRGKAPAAKAVPGGILGFRGNMHELGTHFFREQKKLDDKAGARNSQEAFYHGRNAGKIAPEERIMRGMRTGKKVAHGALGAGLAATAYGVHRAKTPAPRKQPVHKARTQNNTDKYNGALVGTGGTAAAIAEGGSRYLNHHKHKQQRAAIEATDKAGEIVPGLAGCKHPQMTVPQIARWKRKNPGKGINDIPRSMYPSVSDGEVRRNPKIMHGVSQQAAREAGELRGAARQHRHFAEVFGSTAKGVKAVRNPALIVGAAGAGGMLASKNRPVKKSYNVSAFGVNHG